MPSPLNALEIRRRLGRDDWAVPIEYGDDGWMFRHRRQRSSVIVSIWQEHASWIHASISHSDHTPSYHELVLLHGAVWQDRGWAIQLFTPTGDHVNIHEYALHLWGRRDGRIPDCIPNFGRFGTI